MKNRFGEALDSNGYAPSIVQPSANGDGPHECFICHRKGDTVRHEAFFGPYRKKSKQDGFWVTLCVEHHTGNKGAHNCRETDLWIKRCAQVAGMYHYGWTTMEFISEYGKNYRED